MDVFKYFGNKPNPELKRVSTGLPIDPVDYDKTNLNLFFSVFRTQVGGVVRSTKGLFTNGIYETLTPQHGAFERLMELIDQKEYKLASVTNASHAKDEFLINAEVHIPRPRGGNILVNFKLGLCKDFVNLLKEQTSTPPDISRFPKPFSNEKEIPEVLKGLRLEPRYNYGKQDLRRFFYQSPEGYFYEIEIKSRTTVQPNNENAA